MVPEKGLGSGSVPLVAFVALVELGPVGDGEGGEGMGGLGSGGEVLSPGGVGSSTASTMWAMGCCGKGRGGRVKIQRRRGWEA